MSIGIIVDTRKKEMAWEWTKNPDNFTEMKGYGERYQWHHESAVEDLIEIGYTFSKRMDKKVHEIVG